MIRALQFVSPESQGIRSEDVLEFIRLAEEHKINLHSFLMARGGKTYLLTEGNPLGWKSFRFDFSEGTLSYENKRGLKTITFGMGALKKGKFPETHYYGNQCGTPADREFDCLAACEWMEAQALLLRIYITDTSFGQTIITFSFKGDEVGIYASKRAEFFLDDYQGVASGKLK